MSFSPQSSQGFEGSQGQVPGLFSRLFGQGGQNLQQALPQIGELFGPGNGFGGGQQDFLQQLLQQFLSQQNGNGGLPGLPGLGGGGGFEGANQLALSGIMDIFNNNPNVQPSQRQIDVGNRNANLGGGVR